MEQYGDKASPSLEDMFSEINGGNVMTPEILAKLRLFSLADRELISRTTGTITVYFDDEVSEVRKAEETAALRAIPHGFSVSELNGLNIGCGDRVVDTAILGVDIARKPLTDQGGHGTASANSLLAHVDDLPFRSASVDFIIALHVLEHLDDPVGVLQHWLDRLKPGGGIGLILPDWRYTWDARTDESAYGHKWNAEPDLVYKLWQDHLSQICFLEAIRTYKFKLSFDVVLRKPGVFRGFVLPSGVNAESGASRYRRGAFLSLDTAVSS